MDETPMQLRFWAFLGPSASCGATEYDWLRQGAVAPLVCALSGHERGWLKREALGWRWSMGESPMQLQFWTFPHRCIMGSSWVSLAALRCKRSSSMSGTRACMPDPEACKSLWGDLFSYLHGMLVCMRPSATQVGTHGHQGVLHEDLVSVFPMCIRGQRNWNGWKRQSAQVRALGGCMLCTWWETAKIGRLGWFEGLQNLWKTSSSGWELHDRYGIVGLYVF
jgi:hypothetical protein